MGMRFFLTGRSENIPATLFIARSEWLSPRMFFRKQFWQLHGDVFFSHRQLLEKIPAMLFTASFE